MTVVGSRGGLPNVSSPGMNKELGSSGGYSPPPVLPNLNSGIAANN
jgi:hypothetical protein